MKTCKICGAELSGRRRAICSPDCRKAARREHARERYHSDPAYAEHKKAYSRAYTEAHPEWRKTVNSEYHQQRKRVGLARVLSKVRA